MEASEGALLKISLQVLTLQLGKIALPPIGLPYETDLILPGSKHSPGPGLGESLTLANCKQLHLVLSQAFGQDWVHHGK